MISLDEAMLYAPVEWHDCSEGYTDIRYHKSTDGIAKITINRPQVRNAFRPLTVKEMIQALADARYDDNIGVIVLTGEGEKAFCAGGDQKVRGDYGGYQDDSGVHHLNVLDFQRQIRTCPKPVVAMVAGYSIGGGHVLHMMCDLTIAAENAIFGQTGPKVGSFDGGWGASYMARIVGQKKAREIWFLCRQYDAQQALDMGLVNTVVPLADLEKETVRWCREMLQNSPMALRCLKAALNADCDGQAGLQELAGNATMLFYMTEEGRKDATPSTRNVSRTSANLNGIHNARFAGLPLADTDGRGRGAARAAVKNPRRAVHPPAGGEREGWAKFLPCRDSVSRRWKRRKWRC